MTTSKAVLLINFTPPIPETLSFKKSCIFLGTNFCLAGIWGTVDYLSANHLIKDLTRVKTHLKKQICLANAQREKIQTKMNCLVSNISLLKENELEAFANLKKEVGDFSNNTELQSPPQFTLLKIEPDEMGVKFLGWTILRFLVHYILNVLTLGIYSLFVNHQLKNRISYLEYKINCMKEESQKKVVEQYDALRKTSEAFLHLF